MAPYHPRDLIGNVVGDYQIEDLIDQGGMGAIYKGQHRMTLRRAAIKVLHPAFAANRAVADRFITEARTTAKLKHPNIVDVLDMGRVQGEDGELTYLALELLEGRSWRKHLGGKSIEATAPSEVIKVLGPIMDALAYAHSKGIIHRDLKPGNIVLHENEDGTVVPKLLDFGLAKALQDENRPDHTVTGTLMGTPIYMSPEQAKAEKDIGPPSDVWSIAVMFYHAVAGRTPYAVKGQQVIFAVVVPGPMPLRSAARGYSEELYRWIDSALQKEAHLRPSISDLAAGLRHAIASDPRAGQTLRELQGGHAIDATMALDGPPSGATIASSGPPGGDTVAIGGMSPFLGSGDAPPVSHAGPPSGDTGLPDEAATIMGGPGMMSPFAHMSQEPEESPPQAHAYPVHGSGGYPIPQSGASGAHPVGYANQAPPGQAAPPHAPSGADPAAGDRAAGDKAAGDKAAGDKAAGDKKASAGAELKLGAKQFRMLLFGLVVLGGLALLMMLAVIIVLLTR